MTSDQSDRAYQRFIVVAGARTGSTLLVQALNSHPRVRCFGELFNTDVDFVAYGVDAYDGFDPAERALRDSDHAGFLRQRVFPDVAGGADAVGFKLLYGQERPFAGLLDNLVADTELRMIHTRRRDLLRAVVSWKLAETSGVWVQPKTAVRSTATRSNAGRALRHPLRAGSALLRRLRLASRRGKRPQPVSVSVKECEAIFAFIQTQEVRFDNLFNGHKRITVYYEDLVEGDIDWFGGVQQFIGVERRTLDAPLQRQNPQAVHELLANYEELRAAFSDTPYARYFA